MKSEWTLNEEIVFKTTSEIRELNKKKSDAYSVLWYNELTSQSNKPFKYRNKKGVTPVWNFGLIEKKRSSGQFVFFIPKSADITEIHEAEMKLYLRLMLKHFKEFEERLDKNFLLTEMAEDESIENCPKLGGQDVYIREDLIYDKVTVENFNENYTKEGLIVEMKKEDYLESISKKEDMLIGMVIPFNIVGDDTEARVKYFRVFINVKTLEIYASYGNTLGQVNKGYFRDTEFKYYGVCEE